MGSSSRNSERSILLLFYEQHALRVRRSIFQLCATIKVSLKGACHNKIDFMILEIPSTRVPRVFLADQLLFFFSWTGYQGRTPGHDRISRSVTLSGILRKNILLTDVTSSG